MMPRLRRLLLPVLLTMGAAILAVASGQDRSRAAAPFTAHLPVLSTGLTGVAFEPVVDGLGVITDIAGAGDDRLFIAERSGRIRIVRADGSLAPEPFLDIHSQVESADREQGLLGLAFHPDYARNGQFFIFYNPDTEPPQDAPGVVARFNVDPTNPNRARRDSETAVLVIPAAGLIHQGGGLRFGPDGTLYIGVGDGSAGQLAQDRNSLRGKVLRVAVTADGYAIPPDNPYAAGGASRPEIWASGLRNPYHLAVDRQTGDVLIADVGAHHWEEVNLARTGGRNFGWPCLEGPDVLSSEPGCLPLEQFAPPVFVYDHDGPHCAIIGGAVYRGAAYPLLAGHYLFGDFCSGAVWSLLPQRTVVQPLRATAPFFWTASGEGSDGDVYMAGMTDREGTVVRVVPGGP